jgi:argininosuccinate lyase
MTDEPAPTGPGVRRRPAPPGGEPLWGGRFAKPPAPEAHNLSVSLGFDVRLAAHDVRASLAHVEALRVAGLLSPGDAAVLAGALRDVGAEIAAGTFSFDPADEDVHSAIERGVIQRLGDLGARLHAGRSRNDLVVTDLRLWLLDAHGRIAAHTTLLIRTLVDRAGEHASTIVPGTTHGRLAQPVTLGHHLLAHAWGLVRDLGRFDDWETRAGVSPLGAGALATSTLGLDPQATSRRLGLARSFENSIDAVADRDFAMEALACASILSMHLSRIAADLARWTDEALAWAELDEGYSTGSSMMPQKRNPDTAELVRAKAARVTGDFVVLASLLQGLPLGYHRDLQEDKEPLFDAFDTLELVLPAITGALGSVRFDTDRMREAAGAEGLYATDLAEALVRTGVAFREAHRRTGELLKSLAEHGGSLRDLSAEEWSEFGLAGGERSLDPDHAVAARAMRGGPSPESVRHQIEAIGRLLADRSARIRDVDG